MIHYQKLFNTKRAKTRANTTLFSLSKFNPRQNIKVSMSSKVPSPSKSLNPSIPSMLLMKSLKSRAKMKDPKMTKRRPSMKGS
jgi:hypothetical protein